jgi:hypothetical protein
MSLKSGLHREGSSHGVCCAMVLLLIASVASPLQAGSFFSIESTRGHPGTTVAVPITLRGETNVVALQADIHFDPATLLPAAINAGTAAANRALASSDPVPGVRRLLIYSLTSTPMTNGVVAALNFTVQPVANQNALRLSLSNVLLVTAVPAGVPSTNRNGLIVINPIFIGANREAGFILTAPGGETNIIQASTDLLQWTDIGRVVPASTALEFTDTNAPLFARRFYRAVPAP